MDKILWGPGVLNFLQGGSADLKLNPFLIRLKELALLPIYFKSI